MRGFISLVAAVALTAACQTDKTPRQDALAPSDPPAAAGGRAMLAGPAPFSPVGHPAGSCVTDAEIAAEQTIRLHATLMVTGLTCHGLYREPTLFSRYQAFTESHEDRLNAAQETMSTFLSRYQGGNQDRLYDTYQTKVANAEARLLATASARAYCRQRRDRFYTAAAFDDDALDAYVDRMVERHRGSYRVCG